MEVLTLIKTLISSSSSDFSTMGFHKLNIYEQYSLIHSYDLQKFRNILTIKNHNKFALIIINSQNRWLIGLHSRQISRLNHPIQ